MNLTERDLKMLQDIREYGLLPTRKIAGRHFENVAHTTVLRRLRNLETSRYIQRLNGLKNGEHAWCLTRTAAELLNDKPSKTSFPAQIIEHDLTLMELRMRLEEQKIALAWKPEHEVRVKMAKSRSPLSLNSMHVPDGIMGVSTGFGYQEAVAIELELTAKSQARYRDIFANYIRRNLWSIWYVVEKPTIAKQILKALPQNYHGRGPGFHWSLLEDVMKDPLNATLFHYFGKMTVKERFLPEPKQYMLTFEK